MLVRLKRKQTTGEATFVFFFISSRIYLWNLNVSYLHRIRGVGYVKELKEGGEKKIIKLVIFRNDTEIIAISVWFFTYVHTLRHI